MGRLLEILSAFFAVISITFCFALPASAQQKIKVKKIKGNQAIVEFPSSMPLQMGEVYEVTPLDDLGAAAQADSESRNHLIDLSVNFSSYKSNAVGATQSSSFSASGRFGFNYGNFEWGPVAQVISTTSLSVTSSSYLGGLFADYNLIPNTAGEVFIYGLGAVANGGVATSSGTNTTSYAYYLGPFVKWFPFANSIGLRFDADYSGESKVATAGGTAAYTGFVFLVGISDYF